MTLLRRAEITRRWRKKNPERNLAHQRRYYLKKKYGITPEEYDARLSQQGGLCAICGTQDAGPWPNLVVDHDHETGQVRGLLCHTCNTGIGHLCDSVELLRSAINYLEGE